MDANVLSAIPNIGKTMISVVLNFMGYYGSVKMGIGVDTHVVRNL